MKIDGELGKKDCSSTNILYQKRKREYEQDVSSVDYETHFFASILKQKSIS